MRKPPNQFNKQDQRNLIAAVILCVLLIGMWQMFVEAPRRRLMAQHPQVHRQIAKSEEAATPKPEITETAVPREERLKASPRVGIQSGKLRGSIALKGLRFDDLVLTRYLATLDPAHATPPEQEAASPDNRVVLLSPSGGPGTYFAQIGWLPARGASVKLPDENTVWTAGRGELTPAAPVTFRWDNGEGLRFAVTVAMDKDYMFTFTQRVENGSGHAVSVVPYAFVNRTYQDAGMHAYILHEGALGVLTGSLSEIQYKDLREKHKEAFEGASGWLGFTDKYWLTALVPPDHFDASFSHYESKGRDRYQADYTAPAASVAPGAAAETSLRFFAGAKEIEVLDAYAKGNPLTGAPPIPLFDRAVDFGVLYFITKPMFLLLNLFHKLVGNFGIAIIMLTFVIKGLMFPVANKGYRATTQMRALQPEMARLRETYANDRLKMQQELLALYKREKVNPAAGCLPIFIQIPVFFALYKVLYVTIEMRHAPFFGWLRDLSAADPSNVFTLFGLLQWHPPGWLHIGALPLFYGITMLVQMRQQPKPTDPTQATMIKIMPYFLTVVFAKMPAGLVLYWTCSNILSIIQQWFITRQYKVHHPDPQPVR